jgi:hypothetical protein
MEQVQPKHGARRNRRVETDAGPNVEYVAADTGEIVYSGPICSSSYSVDDRYCASCDQWFVVKGIMGALLGCPNCQRPW